MSLPFKEQKITSLLEWVNNLNQNKIYDQFLLQAMILAQYKHTRKWFVFLFFLYLVCFMLPFWHICAVISTEPTPDEVQDFENDSNSF
jgi:hypothetical protein